MSLQKEQISPSDYRRFRAKTKKWLKNQFNRFIRRQKGEDHPIINKYHGWAD